MIDDFAKQYLHDDLRAARQSLLTKLDGLSEYDARRPLTKTGTNLLGLVKHVTLTEARYFGAIFGRPFPRALPSFDDPDYANTDHLWVTEAESRADIVGGYQQAVHVLTETNRHAGHADILREQLDGVTGSQREDAFWIAHRSRIEKAARASADLYQ